MYDRGGGCLAVGDTMWVYVNVDRQEPAEPDEDTAAGWLPEDFGGRIVENCRTEDRAVPVSRRIRVPVDGKRLGDCVAEGYILDTNGHANNVRLTELAMRLAGADNGSCVRLRAEFKEQVKAQSVICPVLKTDIIDCGDETGGMVVNTMAFKDIAGNVKAVFEFAVADA